ncbi:MAG TPA: cysteine--tRNA ligase [Candidatus Limnocylindrales bacterium]|nr:cysteine--tRNA ligase [Candidatus Limnocylindrales bacterium]
MKLYNSLTRQLENFTTIEEKKVKIYVCGITPYDTTHLGHAFTYLFFDSLIRYLKYKDYEVVYTQNVTDINDRDNDILKRAQAQSTSWQNLAKIWTDKFLRDMEVLNWIKPDNYLFASEHIPTMTNLIKKLIEKDYAYQINGGVYFDISKKKNFGKLSGFDENKMLEVAKEFDEDIENPDKKNQLDITLWRPTTKNQSEHIPSFPSTFGAGRPGWHLECSAMAQASLGEQIDIHGGGTDLLYPHHESEIAQSEGATGKIPFSKFWLHTQLVSYQGNKMSKSLGNLVLISDLLKKYSANAIRYMLLSHHYRETWEFSEVELDEAENKILKIKPYSLGTAEGNQEVFEDNSRQARTINSGSITGFVHALDDDMDTPKALEIMLKARDKEETKRMAEVLGFKI